MRTGANEYIWKIIPFLLVITFTSFVCAEASPHAEAVALARSGKLKEAIQQLEALQKAEPNNNAITDDLIVIYCWNGQLQEASSLFEQRPIDTYPRYVHIAVQKAYRDIQKPDQALEIIGFLLNQQQDDPDLLLFKGLLLVDKKELEIARHVLDDIEKTTGRDSRYYRLSAYLNVTQQRWLPALSAYQHLSELRPDETEPSVEQFVMLRNILAGWAAENFLEKNKNQQIAAAKERAKLLMNQSAVKLRWSQHASKSVEEKRRFALEALALHIKALELLNAEGESTEKKKGWPNSMIRDIVVALRNLEQWDDAQRIYHYLTEQGDVPEYVKLAAAEAMLSDRHPEKSRTLYQHILEENPQNYDALTGLFYSLVEDEDFDEAIRLIDTAASKEPVFRYRNNSKTYNERYLDFNVYKAMARLYANQLEEAWLQADELVRNAPANTWLHEVRGDVAGSRGWPKQGLQDYLYAALLEPNDVDILGRKISALIHLGAYQEARPLLRQLVEKHPHEEAVEKVWKEWVFSRKPEFWADISWSRTSGTKFDGESLTASSEVLSTPLNDLFFIEALYRFSWEKFSEEGEETFNSYSTGISYRPADWNFTGLISYNDSSLQGVGGSLKATWSPDDFWKLSFTGEHFSKSTPLRALNEDIRLDTLAGEMTYRWSEQRNVSLGIEKKTFTDGNSGITGSAVLTQRLLEISHVEADGRLEIYGSENSANQDVPYFFPDQDFSLAGGLHFDHIYYRHYDNTFKHELDLGCGLYKQKGYDNAWIGHIRYEHSYAASPWIEMHAGIEFGWNTYDGESELNRTVNFLINWKF